MIAVMASTNIDKRKIDFAGVDSGAKILVITVDPAGSAAQAAAVDQNKNAKICTAPYRTRQSCQSIRRIPYLYSAALDNHNPENYGEFVNINEDVRQPANPTRGVEGSSSTSAAQNAVEIEGRTDQ
jgi:hypothetical protein